MHRYFKNSDSNNRLSVMPCRLNGDVHEWFNEVVAVPNQNLLNSSTGEHASNAYWEAETL